MYSYDWIVLVTLGLDRWEKQRLPAPHEIELREIRKTQAARQKAGAPAPSAKPLLARLLRRRRRRQEATACSGCPSA